ncbi:hypothetical protein ACLBX9_23780 [Methylobacterium sp. A49B]
MTSTEELAATLRTIATPGMKPKAIRAAIRERHPDASKKEIVRAAFFAVAESAASQEATSELHDFALAERVAEENADVVLRVGKRKKKKRSSADAG